MEKLTSDQKKLIKKLPIKQGMKKEEIVQLLKTVIDENYIRYYTEILGNNDRLDTIDIATTNITFNLMYYSQSSGW